MKFLLTIALVLFSFSFALAQKPQRYQLNSPDGNMVMTIDIHEDIRWSLSHKGHQIVTPSVIAMELEDGSVFGRNAKVVSTPRASVNAEIKTLNYKKSSVIDHCEQLTILFKGDFGIVFRAYNDAAAYRLLMKQKEELLITNETVEFNFAGDQDAFIPIQWDYRGGKNFNSSFEALYREIKLSQFPKDSLAFLPLLVDVGQNKKAVILEVDLEDYPGLYLNLSPSRKGLTGVFAPYPLTTEPGGYNQLNLIPTTRARYMAKTKGTRSFPWRVLVVSEQDKDLLDNDIVQKLASPNRLTDVAWIQPGLVAWDWWNNWNVTNVDFKAGINTATYKHYIDFAAKNKIPYIVMDAGWSNELDLYKVNPDIDLKAIIDYGKQKSVSVILWASWSAVLNQMDKAFPEYSAMGVKGFKIDFIDRDDQIAVTSLYTIAQKAAESKLVVDYHGVFKPTGLHKTYPNVLGYEGVKGLENYKWANEDQPRYAVTIPFIRMIAGPMDYTPGAFRNSNQANFRAISDNPMSKGTRVNQMAMFVVFEAPLQMLSDNPTIYSKEQECTDFIARVPVAYDATVALDGEVGEYLALARRKENQWYVAAMTNWTPRELTIDLSFLPEGDYRAEVFRDGANADRDGTDYKKESIEVTSGQKLKVQLAAGGGWVARLVKIK